MALSSAKGATIELGDGASTEAFTEIAQVNSGPSGGGPVVETISTRTHDSTATHKKATFVEYQDVTFGIAYDSTNAQHAQLLVDASAGTLRNFVITKTDGGAEISAFAAFISMDFSSEVDAWNEASLTLVIDGAVAVS